MTKKFISFLKLSRPGFKNYRWKSYRYEKKLKGLFIDALLQGFSCYQMSLKAECKVEFYVVGQCT